VRCTYRRSFEDVDEDGRPGRAKTCSPSSETGCYECDCSDHEEEEGSPEKPKAAAGTAAQERRD
jgi:hypothetical protein